MFSLFGEEYDEEATVKSVKTLLKQYRSMHNFAKRASGVDDMALQSVEITDMPRAQNFENSAENKLIRAISPGVLAKWHCVHCKNAIEAIEDEEQRTVLQDKFIKGDTNTAISLKLSIEKATFQRRLFNACLTFADIYGLEELKIKKGSNALLTFEEILELNDQEIKSDKKSDIKQDEKLKIKM